MMPSKKRGRDGSEIKRPTKRTKLHRDNFLKRERERLEHERESDSLKLIAEIQKNERETRLQKKEQEIKNIMMCINLEHEDALQNAKFEFNKRKNVSDIDRERLKQDLEFIDSRYDDMRSQCLKNMKDKEEVKIEDKEELTSDTELRILHLELCSSKDFKQVSYKDILAYRYAAAILKERGLSSEQMRRFDSALKKCKDNNWK
jgi:hypothetical protein